MSYVRLTQEEYLRLLRQQTDFAKRVAMKVAAHPAMYGDDPDARVLMPSHLIEGLKLE